MSLKNDIITSDDILGKDVIDTDGQVLGVAQQLRIDKKTKKILGILIDQGFMKSDLFIGLNYIGNFGSDTVFLNTTPKPKLKGLRVYDRLGKMVGHVYDVEEENNQLRYIFVRRFVFSKSYKIKNENIKTFGYSIILNNSFDQTPKEELLGYYKKR